VALIPTTTHHTKHLESIMQTTDSITVRDITDTDTRPAGSWTSADGQGQMDMTGSTLAEARATLLGQCADDEQREGILAGSLEVVEES
jgi:hypothetical protein